jgi:thioredoxin 1
MTGGSLREFTAETLESELDTAGVPVLVDFWAPWCGKCMLLAPAVSKVVEDHGSSLRAGKVDISEYPEVGERFGVQGLPTLLLIKNRNEVMRLTDFRGKAALEAAVAPHLDTRESSERSIQ